MGSSQNDSLTLPAHVNIDAGVATNTALAVTRGNNRYLKEAPLITPTMTAGRVGIYQTETFKCIRQGTIELENACVNLEALLRYEEK